MSDDRIGTGQTPETLGIIVNTAFAEQIGEEGVRRYVEVLEAAAQNARDGGAAGDVEEHLRSTLDDAGIQLAAPRYAVLAEQLVHLARHGGPLSVALDDGTVLAGPRLVVPGSVPAEQGEPDPESSERPTYS
jgi:hypothetical protein